MFSLVFLKVSALRLARNSLSTLLLQHFSFSTSPSAILFPSAILPSIHFPFSNSFPFQSLPYQKPPFSQKPKAKNLPSPKKQKASCPPPVSIKDSLVNRVEQQFLGRGVTL
jgi:hypothetical protein